MGWRSYGTSAREAQLGRSRSSRYGSTSMTRPRTTAGKRNVQQQKHEKQVAKRERRAARRAAPPDENQVDVTMSEPELINELATLHAAVESGEISLRQFEERREDVRRQLQQLGEGNSNE